MGLPWRLILTPSKNQSLDFGMVLRTNIPRMANMVLRGIALGSKSVLIIILAKLFEPKSVGIFGLFVASIAFGVLLIGADFYIYSQRELLSVSRRRWNYIVQQQAVASILIYLIAVPLQLSLFFFDLLPSIYMGWFICLLITEHIAQEINRLLIAMQRPLLASVVLIIRMGAWVWIVVPLMWIWPAYRDLSNVFLAWLIGAQLAVLFGGVVVWFDLRPHWRLYKFDKPWIFKGYKVGLMFLLASLSFRILQIADRYIVKFLVGPDLLGVYVLFIGFAMAIVNFIDPAVFSFLYPPMVSAYRRGDILSFNKLFKEMALSAVILSVSIAAFLAFFAPWILDWIGKPIYNEYLPLLWVLLGVGICIVVSMVPHYGLYAMKSDKVIVYSQISSLAVFLFTVLMLFHFIPFYATAFGLLAAFFWVAIIKSWVFLRFLFN